MSFLPCEPAPTGLQNPSSRTAANEPALMTLRWRRVKKQGNGLLPVLAGSVSAGLWSLRFDGWTRVLVLGLGGLVGLLLAAGLRMANSRTSLSLYRDRLVHRRMFATDVVALVPPRGLRLVEITVDLGRSQQGIKLARWLVLDNSGRVETRIVSSWWDPADLDQLLKRTGIPQTVEPGVKSPHAARVAYPGSVSAYAGRWLPTLWAVFFVAVVAVTILQN